MNDFVPVTLIRLHHPRLNIDAVFWASEIDAFREVLARARADDPCWNEDGISATPVMQMDMPAQFLVEDMERRMYFGRVVSMSTPGMSTNDLTKPNPYKAMNADGTSKSPERAKSDKAVGSAIRVTDWRPNING